MRKSTRLKRIVVDNRNIQDELKHMTTEEVHDHLLSESFPFSTCMTHWKGDYNIGMLVRNTNAFGGREVFYLGRRRWDRRHAVGTQHYTDVTHIDLEQLREMRSEYFIVGIDNIEGSVPVETFDWPFDREIMILFGEEKDGLAYEPGVIELCDAIVSIEQFGSVRSMNAGCSSAIILYDYQMKRRAAGS